MSNVIEKKRIEYIDLLKGFAILWIVWWHTCHPSFVNPYYHVPLFFVISGFFFKPYTFKVFLKKKVESLLFPFIFFYLISYVYRMGVHIWDNRTIAGFPWLKILDVFKCMPNGDYLWVNVPIWFLLCLFNVSIIYYVLNKLPKWVLYIYILLVILFTNTITQFSTPFFLNDAMRWCAYYSIGNVLGTYYLAFLNKKKNANISLLLASIIYSVLIIIPIPHIHEIISSLFLNLKTITFIAGIIPLFSLLHTKSNNYLTILSFYGKNSLSVLGFHVPILIIFQRIVTKIWGSVDYWGGFLCFAATSIILFFLIPITNRLFPNILANRTR